MWQSHVESDVMCFDSIIGSTASLNRQDLVSFPVPPLQNADVLSQGSTLVPRHHPHGEGLVTSS